MTGRYKITLQVWPYSGLTKRGAVGDQEMVGSRNREFFVKAQDFADAYKQANLIIVGIASHHGVWEVPITGITYESAA